MSTVSRRTALGLLAGSATLSKATAAPAPGAPLPLRRGVSFHGPMNWPDVRKTGGGIDYVWPPFQSAQRQVSAEQIAKLREHGFDFVRLTVDPSIFIASDESRRSMLCDILAGKVMQIVGVGMSVVVDLHPVAVNPLYAPDNLVAGANGPLFEAYRSVVSLVAACLTRLPSPNILFELMNEPRLMRVSDAPRWQQMLQQLHETARNQAPRLPLVLTGAQWSSREALLRLDPRPFRTSNVFYTFHYYDPHTFTHQGVRGEPCQQITGLHWPPQTAQEPSVLDATARRIDEDQTVVAASKTASKLAAGKLVHDYFATRSTPDVIFKVFSEVREWAAQHAILPERILLGEFGAGWGIGNDDAIRADTYAWLKAVANAAEACRFPWALWAYDPHFKPDLLAALGLGSRAVMR